ncbi:MAG TPA: oligosaccharide flippase family protein [Acidobacteriaceae bacterium]|jgi:O-antigen/teichoic acid export membrane protein|nr:oligosaccharide flippase family protein [Acidobacteriaceae bacterium]
MRSLSRARSRVGDVLTGDALRAKVMRGGAWLGTGSVAEQAVRFGRNMILARLLVPGAFGTMAIVLSSAAVVNTLTDIGERGAIIQNPRGDEQAYFNASWWMGFGRALLSYFVIFSVAPWIAHFYGRPELSGLLRVALLGVLFNAAMSPRGIVVQRQMKLGRWAAITNGGGISGVIITVVLSFFMRDVWALAIGYCTEDFSRFVLSYILCPGAPKLRIDLHAARELLSFSRGIFGLAPLNLIIARADIFVLGRLCSLSALGLYSLAISLVVTPSVFITNMLGQTLMPALSSIQDDSYRMNRILLEVTSWLLLLGMPTALFISLSAPSLLKLAYGPRYTAAAGPLSVAAFAVLLTILNAVPTTVLFARGRPGLHRQGVIVTAVVMLVAIYPASRSWGPTGAQVAALVSVAVGFVYQVILLRAVTGLSVLRYGSAFVAPSAASAAVLGVMLGTHRLGLVMRPSADVALCIVSCLIASGLCASAHLRALKKHKSFYNQKPRESAVAL